MAGPQADTHSDPSPNRPHHAVRAGRGHPPELPRIGDACRLGVVGAGFECGAASRASHVAYALDKPPGRRRRVAEHPHLAAARLAAAQCEEPVTRVECGAHRVLDNGEPAQRPGCLGMVAAHPLRVS